MRTFHIGGTATRVSRAVHAGRASPTASPSTSASSTVRKPSGELIAMNRNGIMAVVDEKGREKERYPVVYGARILVEDGAPVEEQPDPARVGSVHLLDPDRSQRRGALQGPASKASRMQEQVDEVTGMSQLVVTDSPDEKRQPTIVVRPRSRRPRRPTQEVPDADPCPPDGARRRRGPRRRRAGQDPARNHQDQGHHRRSAARGGTVRSAQAARNRRHRRDQRHGEVRRNQQGPAQDLRRRRRRRSSANTRCPAAFTSTCRKASASRPASR